MKLLFISTLNLATNPRLFKEIELALDNGFEVEVVCFEFDNWSYTFNQQLKEKVSRAKFTIIPAGRSPFWPWAGSVFLEKAFRFAGKFVSLPDWALSHAVSRRSVLLTRAVKKISEEFDLVIGHNPGALYPAFLRRKDCDATLASILKITIREKEITKMCNGSPSN